MFKAGSEETVSNVEFDVDKIFPRNGWLYTRNKSI